MKKLTFVVMVVMVVSLALIACGQEAPVDHVEGSRVDNEEGNAKINDTVNFSKLLQVKGSDTMVNLGQRWAEEFMEEYPEAQIAVTGGGSGTGISAIINGTADIAQASRKMKDEEMEQAKANGFELKEIVTGMDGISMVLHKDNTIENLTLEELAAIFTGTITNWKELGGHDAEITIYSRESNSGTYSFVKEFVLEDEEFAAHANLLPSNQAIVEALKQDKNGIGYIGLAYLNDDIKPVSVAKDKDSDPVEPSVATVQNETYPVARPLFLYVAGEPEGVIKLYLDFIMGSQGQEIVGDTGFIPIN